MSSWLFALAKIILLSEFLQNRNVNITYSLIVITLYKPGCVKEADEVKPFIFILHHRESVSFIFVAGNRLKERKKREKK
ncbi:hypothetical protein P8452_35529 [Trifolium repens]|nr:hypothetical protein P8452_35529 [Trifolium repens]